MNITFIAPPAAGKGVQSNLTSEKYNLPHISTGDLLRGVSDENVQKMLANGEFVDNRIVAKLLHERLSQADCENGYVLDGFPRNMEQLNIYESLRKINNARNIIIVLDIPRIVGERRIIGRRICKNCGSVFNDLIDESKPKVPGFCDNCGHELGFRDDDSLVTYNKRYNLYQRETEPLIQHYENEGIVYHVDATKPVAETFKQIENIVGGFYDKR